MAITQKQVRQFLLVGGVVFALTMAYGSGMRAQVEENKKTHEKYKIVRQEARVAQLATQASEAQVHQLEAHRLLNVAANALERGDTGAAKSAVADSVTRLRTAQSVDAATAPDFSALLTDLEAVPLDDAAPAILALNGFAGAMDETFARTASLPAPDALTPVTIPPPTDNEKPTLGNDVSTGVNTPKKWQ